MNGEGVKITTCKGNQERPPLAPPSFTQELPGGNCQSMARFDGEIFGRAVKPLNAVMRGVIRHRITISHQPLVTIWPDGSTVPEDGQISFSGGADGVVY